MITDSDKMTVITKDIEISSKSETDIINITDDVQKLVAGSGLKEGIATVFVSGSTASISTIEFEPNLVSDMKQALERLSPSDIEYRHHATWGDDNGKSHVRATFMGPSAVVPFKDGKLLLGTWQQLICLDFDVPARSRRIVVTLIGE
jgi:secondary thiamine-phosphate synthase enzyme